MSAEPDTSRTSGLEPFRRDLDRLDEEIALLLGERFAICREIALYKRAHEIPMMQPGRVAEVRSRYLARGAEVQLPANFTADLFELLIAATCRMEDELIAQDDALAREELTRTPSVIGTGTPSVIGTQSVATVEHESNELNT